MKRSPHPIYEKLGGMDTFRRLADAFYTRIERDPFLRPMFPRDLTWPRERQALFLAEVFGGPPDYTKKRGKTSLGCRHAGFRIGPDHVRAWLGHMASALDAAGISEPERTILWQYFEETAPALGDDLFAFRHLALKDLEAQLDRDPTLVHRQCASGETLLHVAAGHWDVERVTLLLERGAGVDAGRSPLSYVANHYVDWAGRTSEAGRVVAEILLARGADVNRPAGPERQTPLHIAARRGNLAVAEALLRGGAALEARDTKGETPLRRAVNCGHPEFVCLLLGHGADVNTRDNKGRTALQAARRGDLVALLREHGAADYDGRDSSPEGAR